MKSTLTQEQELIQRQQQILTAQQILQVKLLEMPLAQLEEKVKEELIVNPALEKELPDEGEDDVRTSHSTKPAIPRPFYSPGNSLSSNLADLSAYRHIYSGTPA